MKNIKGFILVLIISISLLGFKPFSISADTISNTNLKGYSSHIELINQGVTSNVVLNGSTINTVFNNYTLCVNGILDDEYIGYANILITYYISNSIVYDSNDQKYHYASDNPSYYRTVSHYVYINGNSFEWYDSNGIIFRNDIGITFSANIQSITISTSNVVKKSVIESIDDLALILNDQLTELQNANIELQEMNDYLLFLTKIRNYDIPFESLLILTYFNTYHDPEDTYMDGIYDFKYPVYKMSGRSFRLYGYKDHQYKMIVLSKSSTTSSFNQNFSISPSTGLTITSSLYSGNTYFFRQSYLYLMTFTFTCTENGNYYFDYIGTDQSYYIVPIYYGDVNNKNISTDFALQFGLSNQLLEDLHIIAQGTQQSNSSVSDLDSATSDMQDSFDDFSAFENQIDTGFNNQMQNIDFTNPLTNNSGIIPAANFVITIFNGLINNNPLSVLIIIVCILLIGKKIIGK